MVTGISGVPILRVSPFDGDGIVRSFPPILIRPEECEYCLPARGKRRGRQIKDVDSQSGITCVSVVGCVPLIDTPVDPSGRKQHDAKGFVARHAPRFLIESPSENLSDMLFF